MCVFFNRRMVHRTNLLVNIRTCTVWSVEGTDVTILMRHYQRHTEFIARMVLINVVHEHAA